MTAVEGDELIRLIVEAMPRKQLVGMRNRYALEATIVGGVLLPRWAKLCRCKANYMIKRYDDPCGQLWWILACPDVENAGNRPKPARPGAGSFQKLAAGESITGLFFHLRREFSLG